MTKDRHPQLVRILIALLMAIGTVIAPGFEPACVKCSIQERTGLSTGQPSASAKSTDQENSDGKTQQPKQCSCSCHHVCGAAALFTENETIILLQNTAQGLPAPVSLVPGRVAGGIERPPRA